MSETSPSIASERDMISKIRARHEMRNEQGYTGHVTDTHASRVREQEVVHQKVGQRTRQGPVPGHASCQVRAPNPTGGQTGGQTGSRTGGRISFLGSCSDC